MTDTKPPRTIKELAREALDVQDACNLSGVVLGFSRAITELRAHMPANEGTAWLNHHPIATAWADKVAHLTGIQFDTARAMAAHAECERLARESV